MEPDVGYIAESARNLRNTGNVRATGAVVRARLDACLPTSVKSSILEKVHEALQEADPQRVRASLLGVVGEAQKAIIGSRYRRPPGEEVIPPGFEPEAVPPGPHGREIILPPGYLRQKLEGRGVRERRPWFVR